MCTELDCILYNFKSIQCISVDINLLFYFNIQAFSDSEDDSEDDQVEDTVSTTRVWRPWDKEDEEDDLFDI